MAFPSYDEGFGLPVLEAMSCGAIAIGANATSIGFPAKLLTGLTAQQKGTAAR